MAPTAVSVTSILGDLKKKASEKTRATYVRHGMAADRVMGVSVAEIKLIAKGIRGQQALACELYQTGMMEAMYLAGMIVDGSLMSKQELDSWAEGAAGLPMISEYAVTWAAFSDWCTLSGLVACTADEDLPLAELEKVLGTAEKEIGNAPNRVRLAMNSFVIAVGVYVKPLSKMAKATAKRMGAISADMGDTACKIPLATAAIEKAEKAGGIGKKRKTMRC